jgi:hypothetical protein
VNLLQQVRGNIQGLDKELQSSFLFVQGRLLSRPGRSADRPGAAAGGGAGARPAEAAGVLETTREGTLANVAQARLTLTPAELQAEEDYQASTAQLVMLGQEWADLRKLSKRTAAQDARYEQWFRTSSPRRVGD